MIVAGGTMARVLVIAAAVTVVALAPTTSVARTAKSETRCKRVCDQARTSAAPSAQQRRLLRTCGAARACASSSNSVKDVEAPAVKTFQPYPCKFFMC
jgi:hypothetical protein